MPNQTDLSPTATNPPASTNPPAIASASTTVIDLDITGMTCAACAARIERKLNKIEGVSASVNYATERARVVVDPGAESEHDLIDVIEGVGYGAQVHSADHDGDGEARLADLRRRLIVAVVLGVPVLLLSMIPALQFTGWQWAALVLATPVATWCAYPFHRAMWLNLRHGQATMDTLVSVGVTAAYLWSVWVLLFTDAGKPGMKMSMSFSAGGGSGHHIYLEVASTVVALILAGRYMEARSKRRAGAAIRAMLDMGVSEVTVVNDRGDEQTVPIEGLRPGQQFIVRPGERVATDGVIVDGFSSIDMSLVTGESLPVDVTPGDRVVGATINQQGRLVVAAERVGADTQLAQMARLVEEAQSGKADVQRLADRVSAVFVPIVIVLALVTLVAWYLATRDIERAFAAGVAVLIIACPCALGLATPTALLVGTGRGAQLGILIKGPEVLESTRQVDTIVLDKTGTVTTGKMSVVSVQATDHATAEGLSDDDILAIAGALERHSEHPVAKAIRSHAETRLGALATADGFINLPGHGVEAVVDGVEYRLGRPHEHRSEAFAAEHAAATRVELVRLADDRPLGTIAVSDTVKETSRGAIAQFRELGLTPVLLTGDHAGAAAAVAEQVGLADGSVIADVRPADKVAVIAELQSDGKAVAMVGDGVNDAAALAQADLGIAMGTGTDVAIEASDLTLVRSDLTAAADAIRLSRRTLATIKGNLFWAFAYNVLAIPLAMSGRLSPAIAGAAMAFSSVFVVTNSLRLRRFQ